MAGEPTYIVRTLPVVASTPATPPVGTVLTYAKPDLAVYQLDSNGLETKLGSGGIDEGEVWFLG